MAQTTATPAPVPIPSAAPPAAVAPDIGATPTPLATTASAPGTKTLTLDQVVNLAVNYNSSVTLARQRLQKAQEQITQVDAQARPQITADLIDTYNSQRTFGTGSAPVSNPALPGGGQIPTIVDQGGGNSSTFVGGGGGGTTSSTGTISTITNTTTTSAGAGTSTTAPTTGTPATGTTGTSTTGGGGTTGTTGTGAGTTGTTGTGAGTTGSATGQARLETAALPPIMQKYVAAAQAPPPEMTRAAQAQAKPQAGTGTGTGVTASTGGFSGGSPGYHNNYSGRISLSQYVDIFGLVPAARDVEKVTRDFYALDLARVQNETALSAKNEFFNVLLAQNTLAVQQEQVNYAQQNLRIAQARFNAGAAPEFDVVTAQTNLSNAQQVLSSDQNQVNLLVADLNNLLGLSPTTPIALQTPPLPPLNQTFDLAQSTQAALQQRPELVQANYNIDIARKLIKLAGATLLPTLGLGAAADYSGNVSTGTPHDDYTVTAQLDIPLYDGGLTRSRVRSAEIDLATQVTTRDQLVQNVALEVLQAYNNISDAQTRSAAAAQGVAEAQEAVRLAQVRYQNGIGTFLDVTNAEASLATARNNLASAQFNYQTSLAQLLRAEGGR